nr:short/branched chain specific acyl-CoA dehydrogenase, mitochondrial-like [Onthophagus taurus]
MNSFRHILSNKGSSSIAKRCARNFLTTSKQFQSTEAAVSGHLPVTFLSDDEQMMKETVSRLAKEQIAPHVREMENNHKIKPEVLKMLFDNGVSLS